MFDFNTISIQTFYGVTIIDSLNYLVIDNDIK